jgi:cold shock CspA family protein
MSDSDALFPQEGEATESSGVGVGSTGVVKRRFSDQRQYGFIHAADGDYYFHLTDVDPSVSFDDLAEGTTVDFEVVKRPAAGKNGNAQNVRPRSL